MASRLNFNTGNVIDPTRGATAALQSAGWFVKQYADKQDKARARADQEADNALARAFKQRELDKQREYQEGRDYAADAVTGFKLTELAEANKRNRAHQKVMEDEQRKRTDATLASTKLQQKLANKQYENMLLGEAVEKASTEWVAPKTSKYGTQKIETMKPQTGDTPTEALFSKDYNVQSNKLYEDASKAGLVVDADTNEVRQMTKKEWKEKNKDRDEEYSKTTIENMHPLDTLNYYMLAPGEFVREALFTSQKDKDSAKKAKAEAEKAKPTFAKYEKSTQEAMGAFERDNTKLVDALTKKYTTTTEIEDKSKTELMPKNEFIKALDVSLDSYGYSDAVKTKLKAKALKDRGDKIKSLADVLSSRTEKKWEAQLNTEQKKELERLKASLKTSSGKKSEDIVLALTKMAYAEDKSPFEVQKDFDELMNSYKNF
jgi:hypothetical protein